MSVSINISDELMEQTDAYAREMSKSREEVVAEALGDFLSRRAKMHLTECMNRLIDELGQPVEPHILATGKEIMKNVEW